MTETRDVQRLPAWTPEIQWCRTAWVSAKAKALWAPRITQINAALKRLEVESVYHGLRQSALVFVDPAGLIEVTREALVGGAVVVPLALHGATGSSYSSQSAPAVAGQPVNIRTIVTSTPDRWMGVRADDNAAVGELLGYPACCREFFHWKWDVEHWRDTTLPMTAHGDEGPPEVNILLRWLGIRLVWHLPCSPSCAVSYDVATAVVALGRKLGFHNEMDWALELLAMPMRWSSLHGIAEITTPLFKISADTDPLARRIDVDKNIGGAYPEESATGLQFPFARPDTHRITGSRSFQRAIEHAKEQSAASAKMNGFGSLAAMSAAHENLVSMLRAHGSWNGAVLDLGCGDGALLERLEREWPMISPHGVECMLDRATAAQQRIHWGYIHNSYISDVAMWSDTRYALVILMPGRLAEMTPTVRDQVVAALTACAEAVLVYTYDGNEASLSPAQVLAGAFTVVGGANGDVRHCRLLVNELLAPTASAAVSSNGEL